MTKKQHDLDSLAKLAKKRAETRKIDLLAVFEDKDPLAGADWGGCDPKWIQSVVEKITALGGAVIFGTSKDGGAHLVTLLLDESKTTQWIAAGDHLDEKLEEMCATLDTLA